MSADHNGLDHQDADHMGEPAGGTPTAEELSASEPEEVLSEQQVAFDINDFPGGVRGGVEAVLMVVDEPVTEETLAAALELPVEDVGRVLDELAREYVETERGFMLRRLGGGWRIYTRPECAPVVEKFMLGGQQARLTQAALETLAVIAYRQPISRARIGAIRGVNVDGVVRTLLARGMVGEVGQDPTGGAVLYGTTELFLQRMGLDSLDDLPALAPYLPSAEVLEELAAEGLA